MRGQKDLFKEESLQLVSEGRVGVKKVSTPGIRNSMCQGPVVEKTEMSSPGKQERLVGAKWRAETVVCVETRNSPKMGSSVCPHHVEHVRPENEWLRPHWKGGRCATGIA